MADTQSVLSIIAVPGVLVLISFLSYSSQVLFLLLPPYPLTLRELVEFNTLIAALLISYYRAINTDPGRLENLTNHDRNPDPHVVAGQKQRWCRKCSAPKPPRAHHCSTCKRCIPKMDHHCPWTTNCVSQVTYPHFLRFVFFAVVAMGYLWKLLWVRNAHLWHERHYPAYHGPSIFQLCWLFTLNLANFITFFALFILLVRSLWNLVINQTTIENWEVERHEVLLRRARTFGGYLDGPDGQRIRISRQEFPYDIGLFQNIAQGMGTRNPLLWFWPLATSPILASGMTFETNGFEDADASWPPPDPDRMIRRPDRDFDTSTVLDQDLDAADRIAAFRQRQHEDLVRKAHGNHSIRKRRTFHKRYDEDGNVCDDSELSGEESGEEAWRNGEGERLKDFGVDEEAEFYDDDVPLAALRDRLKSG